MDKNRFSVSKKFAASLSPMQSVIMALLRNGRDVQIASMHGKLYDGERTPTEQQRAVGAHVARLNMKLRELGFIVRPGTARRTYRIWPLHLAPKAHDAPYLKRNQNKKPGVQTRAR